MIKKLQIFSNYSSIILRTTSSWFWRLLLLICLLLSNFSYGQQPAQTIVKAAKSKMQASSADKLNNKLVRKNTPGTTLDISKDAVKKERQKSETEQVDFGPQQDKQESPLEALKGKKEDLSKRDMSSKHFINDDGTYTALIGGGPIHYDKNGTWEDISHTITPNNNQQYPHSNTTNLLESYFGATAHLGVMSKTKEGEVKEFLNTKMYWEVNGQVVSMQNSNNATVTIDGDKAYYNNLFGAIAAEYSVLSGKRKLNYIIPNAEALGNIPENAEYLIFSEDIVLPDGWKHIVDKSKGVLINDASGETIYAYENPTVYEDYYGELSMPEKDNPASFEIKKIGNTITLFLKVKTTWLQDADRAFPLAIDPTVNVYPNNATFWTGWVDSDGNGSNNAMRVGHSDTDAEIDAFMRFNLSTIPVGSTVAAVTSHLNRNGGNGTMHATNRQMIIGSSNADPLDAVFWGDIFNGYIGNISNSVTANDNNGWKVNTFTPAGRTFIENALVDGYASILAWPSTTAWTTDNYASFHGYSHANRPYLRITYTAPTGPCQPTSFQPNGLYINKLQFVGTLVDPPANTSTFSATGYQDFTGLSPIAVQAQGEGVNVVAYAVGNVHGRGTWKAWVDWNNNGVFEASELVYNIFGFAGSSTTFGFKIAPTRAPGNYRMRIRVNNGLDFFGETFGFNFGPCDPFTSTWNTDNYGETEDYLFTVIPSCSSLITDIVDGEHCGRGPVTLEATAASGVTEFRWYTTETGGTPVVTSPTGLMSSWTTPTITNTTTYYVTAYNGTCESLVRTEVIAKISPTPTVTFTPTSPTVCGDNQIIRLVAAADTERFILVDQKFTGTNLGPFENVNSDANPAATKAKTAWKNKPSVYVPLNTEVNVWFPAISSGFGPNRFAVAMTDPSDPNYPEKPVQNSLALKTAVNTTDFVNLTLELRLYYSRYYPANLYPGDEYVAIELSTNGGATYNVELQRFTANVGIGTRFVKYTYDLAPYIGQTNLKFRIRQYADADINGWAPGGVAVDDIRLFGDKPLNTAFHYNPSTVDAFTDAAATLPYTSGDPITEIYIKPTIAQLERATFTIPVSATLSNGCSATGSIVVVNDTRIYVNNNSDWNIAARWKPSVVPDIDKCVVIPNSRRSNLGLGTNGAARNITVKDGGFLDMKSGSNLTVRDWINVEPTGEFLIRDSASLIQVTEGSPNTNNNTGNIKMQRTVPGGVAAQQYVYWSSPVENFNVGDINTAASEQRFEWNPTIDNVHNGTWIPASGTMSVGKGYIVRGLVLPPSPIPTNTAQFLGRPSNGIITAPINRGTYTGAPYAAGGGTTLATNVDDNWNLVGNPYPSAISADAFTDENALGSNAKINGTIYLWSHTGMPIGDTTDDPFYGNYVYNYLGSNYIAYNSTGPNPPQFGGNIAAGQSFFVEMEDVAGVTNTVTFNNSMRVGAPNNANFLRSEENERNRIWLDLVNINNDASTTLVGYITDATNAKDRLYDGHNLSDTSLQFYSLLDEEEMVIQGRTLPFDQEDIVPLGFKVPQQNDYTIAINSVDGLFGEASQNIYLEDTYMNIIHDLRIAPYKFTSAIGTFNDRFILRYTSQALSTPDANANDGFSIIGVKDYIKVTSGNSPINTVQVYDVLGRLLADYKDVNTLEFKFDLINQSEGALIVKATLYNGQQKIKKVIY